MGGSAIHDALRTLAPISISDVPSDSAGLTRFLESTFKDATILIDSVPLQHPDDTSSTTRPSRSSSGASGSSEIVLSDARPEPPLAEVKNLQQDWGKPVRLAAKENPLGMSVYKLAGNDGKGAWFARHSIHEGLGFSKWKKALQAEFAETLKVHGGPGEGNIRGIGGEKRVECRECGEVGKLEVWDLTAQFPGPTTPREFVEVVCTTERNTQDGKRQFMVVSKPCKHPKAPERDGFIRGQYQSVEIIREVPVGGRNASAQTHGGAADGDDSNPVEWIMLTRSDPGGSVPRFMVERGTPGSIVADASKFLDWACAAEEDELEYASTTVAPKAARVAAGITAAAEAPSHEPLKHEKRPQIHEYQTNGYLAGVDGRGVPAPDEGYVHQEKEAEASEGGGIFSTITDAASVITSRLPALPIPGYSTALPHADERQRKYSMSSSSSDSSSNDGSFASAIGRHHHDSDSDSDTVHRDPTHKASTLSTNTTTGTGPFPPLSGRNTRDPSRPMSSSSRSSQKVDEKEQKELSKFENRKRRLAEKLAEQLSKIRQREDSLGSQESTGSSEKGKEGEKRNENVRKAEEKYERDVRKQEEKFRKEMVKLAEKRERDQRKEIEREVKDKAKSENQQLKHLLEREKHECQVLKVERDLLQRQVGELQKENTRLAVGVSKLPGGEALLNEVRVKREGNKEVAPIDGSRGPGLLKENMR